MTKTYEVLKTAAESIGIEQTYKDTSGLTHYTNPATAAKILEVKGVRIDPSRLNFDFSVIVVSQAELPETIAVPLPVGTNLTDPDKLEAKVIMSRSDQSGDHTATYESNVEIDAATGSAQVVLPYPEELSIGRHDLQFVVDVNGESFKTGIILFVCPGKAYLPDELKGDGRLAGVQLALYGVRSKNNWGVGDFGDLFGIIDWAVERLNVDFIGLNPLHALGNKRPFNNSPYNPSSRFYRNFIYLNVPAIPDFAISTKAASLMESPGMKRKMENLRNEEHVNYEEVAALKLEILREVFRSFMENQGQSHLGNDRWTDFQDYIKAEGVYLERFATFCALEEHFANMPPHPKTWGEWPEQYRNPESAEVIKFQRSNEQALLFWMYLQWQLDEQLKNAQDYARYKGMLLGLYNDEALAVDRNGADFWAWRQYFHDGFRVGAPPDPFAPDGQDWGFPPPDSERIREAAYEPFLKKLRGSCKHGGALRIDHVMQLYHLFWIPQDGQPKDGVYVKDNEADLLNLTAFESNKSKVIIIGEDLGTVPFDFRDRLMAKGILSYRLFYFERDLAENLTPFYEYPGMALVSISTHDLPTLAGFWTGKDIEIRKITSQLDEARVRAFKEERTRHKAKIIERLVNDGRLPAETAHAAWESEFPTDHLHTAVLDFVLRTPSKLVVINQEDIFLDLRQQNLPGTTWENPNWVTKMKFTVEELNSQHEAVRYAEKFKSLAQAAGRGIKRH